MTPTPTHEPLRYVKAQSFIKSLQRHKEEITCQEYKELRGQAIAGDIEGATKGLDQIIYGRNGRATL